MNSNPAFKNPLPGVPAIESPFFSRIFDDNSVDPETRRVAVELNTKGFAVIDFPDTDFNAVADAIKRSLHHKYDWSFWYSTGYDNAIGLRIQDAWNDDENVKRIAQNRHIIDLLTKLYGVQAWPFQTLNFPVGTQQHFHTDSIHFSSVPERFMCGVWTALEDITEDAGPLVYYPGSHKWPIYTNEHIGNCVSKMHHRPTQALYEPLWESLVETHGCKPEIFTAKKGQALIWAANLLHGGTKQSNKYKTRWSQVTHYFFDNCAYYTPMTSDPAFGRVEFRTIRNIVNGEKMVHRYAGYEVPQSFIDNVRPLDTYLPANFDARLYLTANPDVAASGMAAADHFLQYGKNEGRKLRPEDPTEL